jgi:hypothetical protein
MKRKAYQESRIKNMMTDLDEVVVEWEIKLFSSIDAWTKIRVAVLLKAVNLEFQKNAVLTGITL